MATQTHIPDDAALLLDAVSAIGSDLDMTSVLRRIIATSCALTGAKYGFLAVLDDDGGISDYVTHGMSEAIAEHIKGLPQAVGLLGEITHADRPVRIADVADHPGAAGFPANHPSMRTFLGVSMRIGGKTFGNLYLTEKRDGLVFTESDEARVEALAGAAGYVVENARAFAVSEMRTRWLRASSEIVERLHAGEVRAAINLLASGAREACEGDVAALIAPPAAGAPEVFASDVPEGFDTAAWVGSWSDEIAELGADTPQLVRRDDNGATVVLVWLRTQIARRGVLMLRLPVGRGTVDAGLAEMIRIFANQASIAFDRAQSVADRHELMLVAERERIARDLHDVVIQRIFATGLQLQGLRSRIRDQDAVARLEDAVADLDVTIRDIRSAIFELNRHRHASLRAEIADLVVSYTPVLGFAPELRTTGPVDSVVSDELAQQVSSVLREALSNVARHAQATSCRVQVETDGEAITLVVEDDGRGIGESRVESGLRNARRRAEELGGLMTVAERAEGGTALTWRALLLPPA